jgi:hypothetical protein
MTDNIKSRTGDFYSSLPFLYYVTYIDHALYLTWGPAGCVSHLRTTKLLNLELTSGCSLIMWGFIYIPYCHMIKVNMSSVTPTSSYFTQYILLIDWWIAWMPFEKWKDQLHMLSVEADG